MELKEALVQTDAGILPVDWRVAALRELVLLIPGGIYGVESLKDGLLPCRVATTAHIDMSDTWNRKEMGVRYFTSDQLSKYMPKNGDLVVVKSSGSAEKIQSGKIGYIDKWNEKQFVFSNFLMLLRPTKVESLFLYFYLCSNNVKRELPNLVEASTYPNIRINEYLELPIPIPPKAEQHAIATALSDVDGLIAGLEGLLAKKRALKQGAMQQLLNGQKRLPGFTGEWGVKTFGELFSFGGGYSASRAQLTHKGHSYLHYGDIHMASHTLMDVQAEYHRIPRLDVPLTDVSPVALLNDGDIVFVDASEDDDGVSKHVVVSNPEGVPFISGLHTIVAKPRPGMLDKAYARYCFQTADMKRQFRFYAVGTKVSGISKSNIPKLTMPVPSPKEQAAIGAILSDMDAELGALEAKLGKTRLLKQGMMQELLTGRVRLV